MKSSVSKGLSYFRGINGISKIWINGKEKGMRGINIECLKPGCKHRLKRESII